MIKLSAQEVANLGQHDVVIIVDKSTSMRNIDCPSIEYPGVMVSRWQWCREQTSNLAEQTSGALPEGITIVLFSTFMRTFPHVNAAQIADIFTRNNPGGFTNEGMAVQNVIGDYFERRSAQHGKVRPLLIALITDGVPTNQVQMREVLIDATHHMKRPDEIRLTFLQVGQDPEGLAFIKEMDDNLVAEHAKYDMVSSRLFPELVKTGLAKALVDCLSEGQ